MEQIVAFMLLVGCSADGSQCTEIPVPTPSYQSLAECQADLPLQIRLTGTFDSRVVGACKAVEEDLLSQSATIEWALNRGGELLIQVTPEPEMVAEQSEMRVASR